MNVKEIAEICHEANRVICQQNEDYSQKSWNEAEEWQRESAIEGVKFALNNPNASESDQHDAWRNDKIKDGWIFGELKNSEKKTHPCLVAYEKLPIFQRTKDSVFKSIVNGLSKFV